MNKRQKCEGQGRRLDTFGAVGREENRDSTNANGSWENSGLVDEAGNQREEQERKIRSPEMILKLGSSDRPVEA